MKDDRFPEDEPSVAPQRIVTEQECNEALAYLHKSAFEIGDARERAVKASHMLKHVKALIAKTYSDLSAAKAEVEAYASQEYRDALIEDAKAAGALAVIYSLREAADAKVRAWQSEQATLRRI
jgi:hypothetical protein